MEQTAANTETTSHAPVVHRYAPSWVDRLTAWVDSWPGPAWIYYLAAMALFNLAYLFVQWRAGRFPALFPQTAVLTFLPMIIWVTTRILERFVGP